MSSSSVQPSGDESVEAPKQSPSGPAEKPQRRSPSRVSTSLSLLVPVAIIGLLATLLGRAVGPALPGVGVGLEDAILVMRHAGALASQVYAVALSVTALGLSLALFRAQGSLVERVAWPAFGGVVIYLGMRAPAVRLDDTAAWVLGLGATLATIFAAVRAFRSTATRVLALPFAVLAVASAARLIMLGLLTWGREIAASLAGLIRVLAMTSFVADGLVLFFALLVADPGRKRMVRPEVLAALALALFATSTGASGAEPEATPWQVLIYRAAILLTPTPTPAVALGALIFAALLGPVVALTLLVSSRRGAPATAALTLLALARATPDVPLSGLAIFVAAATLALVARDGRALWSVLEGEGEDAKPAPPRAAVAKGV